MPPHGCRCWQCRRMHPQMCLIDSQKSLFNGLMSSPSQAAQSRSFGDINVIPEANNDQLQRCIASASRAPDFTLAKFGSTSDNFFTKQAAAYGDMRAHDDATNKSNQEYIRQTATEATDNKLKILVQKNTNTQAAWRARMEFTIPTGVLVVIGMIICYAMLSLCYAICQLFVGNDQLER